GRGGGGVGPARLLVPGQPRPAGRGPPEGPRHAARAGECGRAPVRGPDAALRPTDPPPRPRPRPGRPPDRIARGPAAAVAPVGRARGRGGGAADVAGVRRPPGADAPVRGALGRTPQARMASAGPRVRVP